MQTHHWRLQRRWPVWALVLMAYGGAGGAHSAPNGLTQIPIAKVFGDGVAAFSFARAVQQSQTTTFTTQYGLFNRIEAGVDYQASPPEQRTSLGNAKLLLAHQPGCLPDIACGLQNVAASRKAIPCVVTTTQPRATGCSLGLMRPGGAGAGYGTVGLIADLTKTLVLNVAYARPNTAGDAAGGLKPRGYILSLAYVFHVKGSKPHGGAENNNPAAGPGGQ